MAHIPKISNIPESDRTPVVVELLEIVNLLQEQVQALKDEIARLKGQKPKPDIKPSKLTKDTKKPVEKGNRSSKRPGSEKRSKTNSLTIHELKDIKPEIIPEGSKFKDYHEFTVQDIIIQPHNIKYRLERWETPEGDYIVGRLPEELGNGHFGPTLISYILYQYYHAHVTQPLVLEQLHEWQIDISSGQLNRIITDGKDQFHAEKDEILRVGLEISNYVHVDDTGARHKGKNGYCTHIGNEFFAWFESTDSKSRVNFLSLLRAGNTDYILSDEAIVYMRHKKLPNSCLKVLKNHQDKRFGNKETWQSFLQSLNITRKRHIQITTEGALLGSVLEHVLNPQLAIISDDAGQFNVLLHALCWVHAERGVHKLVGFSDQQREALETTRGQIWNFYKDLKAYKQAPNIQAKSDLADRFDEIFTSKTCFATLNQVLKRIHKNKEELLLVLDRPDIPLHNNLSENDIRDYVKKRKISGSTRSDIGRRCRDTFASLKKTCRKLGVSFWLYLKDRISGLHKIPSMTELIRSRAQPQEV